MLSHTHTIQHMRCDCSWARSGLGCSTPDGSACWSICCAPNRTRVAHPRAAGHSVDNGAADGGGARLATVCLMVLRWGAWPPWMQLSLRTMELNPTIRFLLLGNNRPSGHQLPTNVAFHRVTIDQIMQRTARQLHVTPAYDGLSPAGGASKISDLKPMLAALLPEKLVGCEFWGYLQEDQLLGDLRAFLDGDALRRYDVISPLLPPMHHAGPFMVYRNVPNVNELFKRSSQWRAVLRSREYLAFDEWWGAKLRDHMASVVLRESKAGKLRSYTAQPQADMKVWLQDDFVYADTPNASCGFTGCAPRRHQVTAVQQASGSGAADAWQPTRWYDEALLLTWQRGVDGVGRLWNGPGTNTTDTLWDGKQGQRAVLHLMGSKHRTWLRDLVATDHFIRLAAHATEFTVSSRGLWIKASTDGKTHSWYSGHFPSVHALVRSSALAAAARSIFALGQPLVSRPAEYAKIAGLELSRRVSTLLPCVVAVRSDHRRSSGRGTSRQNLTPMMGSSSTNLDEWSRVNGLVPCRARKPPMKPPMARIEE